LVKLKSSLHHKEPHQVVTKLYGFADYLFIDTVSATQFM